MILTQSSSIELSGDVISASVLRRLVPVVNVKRCSEPQKLESIESKKEMLYLKE